MVPRLAFSYQGDALKKRVLPLAESLGAAHLFECDVTDMGFCRCDVRCT